MSRIMVEKSFAVWGSESQREGNIVSPLEGFLYALQLVLEEEAREVCKGTSKLGHPKGKITRMVTGPFGNLLM